MLSNPVPPERNELKPYTLPLMVSFVGTLAALYFFYLIRELDRQQTTDAFNQSALSQYNAVTEEVSANLELLSSLKAFIENAGEVNQQSFARFAGSLIQNHGDVQALEWIPRVPDTARAAHEALGQKEGFRHYAIRERGPRKILLPAAPRPEYYPVFYIHPIEGNEAAIGFDLASNPARLAALDRARDSGTPVMTARITLVQEKASQAGLLVFQALYKGRTAPQTVPERRKNLLGFTLIVIRAGDMISKATRLLPPDILLNISDNTDPADKNNLSGNMPVKHSAIRSTHDHVFAGRKWHFIATPSPGAFDLSTPLSASLTFIAAMVAAGLGGMFVYRLSRENIKIAREVGRQTSALKISEERYALAVSGSAVGLWDWDISENKTYWSPRLYEILGIKDPSFTPCPVDFEDRLHPNDKQHVLDAVESHLLHDTPYDVIYRLRAESRHYVWIHAKGQALQKNGVPLRMAGSMDDISDKQVMKKVLETNKHELQMIFDNVPARIWYKDDNNNILRLNRLAADSMSMSIKDVEGSNSLDLFRGKAEKYLQDDQAVIRTGQPKLGVIEKFKSDNQEPTWLRTDKVPFIDPVSGKTHGLISSIDITAQILAEKAKDTAIQAQDKTATELQAIIDTMIDGLIIIDQSGIIHQTNPATIRIFGYSEEELYGQNVSILMPEYYSKQHDTYMDNFFKTGIAKIIGIGRDLTGMKKNG
ncbi:MAG: CHASE domain-containing protein, partial [Kordiimonadaceae bacterium]|nr:CHASE domain-containing protein [Kordiimonadaceae bacterium]